MVRAGARLVELRPHRRVLKLELIACVVLRKESPGASDEKDRRDESGAGSKRSRTIVVQCEDRRGEGRIQGSSLMART